MAEVGEALGVVPWVLTDFYDRLSFWGIPPICAARLGATGRPILCKLLAGAG
jgi:hypothetical protein